MRPTRFLILLVLFVLTGCSPGKSKVQYRLTDDQLAHLMLDIQLSDVMMTNMDQGKQDSLKTIFWKRLSEVYKISADDIKAEIKSLESDPEKMKLIIDQSKAISDSIR